MIADEDHLGDRLAVAGWSTAEVVNLHARADKIREMVGAEGI